MGLDMLASTCPYFWTYCNFIDRCFLVADGETKFFDKLAHNFGCEPVGSVVLLHYTDWSRLNALWSKLSDHPALFVFLMIVAFSVTLYASLIVIWRHDPTFIPGTPVYMVTCILLAITIPLCYKGANL
jgi:hypothetical protein